MKRCHLLKRYYNIRERTHTAIKRKQGTRCLADHLNQQYGVHLELHRVQHKKPDGGCAKGVMRRPDRRKTQEILVHKSISGTGISSSSKPIWYWRNIEGILEENGARLKFGVPAHAWQVDRSAPPPLSCKRPSHRVPRRQAAYCISKELHQSSYQLLARDVTSSLAAMAPILIAPSIQRALWQIMAKEPLAPDHAVSGKFQDPDSDSECEDLGDAETCVLHCHHPSDPAAYVNLSDPS